MANQPKFRRILLVNWLDLPYAQIDLDENVTIFEGGNGSGKTTIMLAALATLMPDKKQLRGRKVSAEKHAIEAIFHRLQPNEPISYAALEIETGHGLFLAGVHITKQKEASSIDLEPFTITKWPDRNSVQDFFRLMDGDKEWTCSLSELKQRAGEWNVHLQAHPTLGSYFKELYDIGALPLTMATDAERSQYAHLLETSMVGGLSAALTVKLKDYLLPESEKLPSTVKLMHDNLRACIGTQNELKSSEEHYKRIAGLFRNLTGYITTLGKRVERDTKAAHTALKLTEQNLDDTTAELENLQAERKKLEKKQVDLEQQKQRALSDLDKLIKTKTNEEQELTQEVNRFRERLQSIENELRPVKDSQRELNEAHSRFAKLDANIPSDPSAEVLRARIKSDAKRFEGEVTELKRLIETSETERTALKKHKGVSAELSALAEQLRATPVVQKYTKIDDLRAAASLEAKLGPLVHGLVVKDLEQTLKQIDKLDPSATEVWLTTADDPANSFPSTTHGRFQKVEYGSAVRLTRIPAVPTLGEAAQKKRIVQLDQQIEQTKKGVKELEPVTLELDEILKFVYRVADEHQSHSLSWLKKTTTSLQTQIADFQSKRSEAEKAAAKAKEQMLKANEQRGQIFESFKERETEIGSGLARNEISIGLKEPLKERLEGEKITGIEKYTTFKKVWDVIHNIPELRKDTVVDSGDIGAALERLRLSLKEVNEKATNEKAVAALPEAVGDDFFVAALELPKIRKTVMALIRSIQPHNLTESSDPEKVIDALTVKIVTLTNRFAEQQNAFRANIDTIANSIHSEIHNRTQRILRWSNDLREVQFGTVKGIRLRLDKIESEVEVLDSLRQQRDLFADTELDPKAALQEFWKKRTGQEITAENALDYRRFVTLTIEVGDGQGKWRPVGGSTGEMVGAALSVLIILLRAWEEEAVLRGRVEPLRLLFLDEAARLDESSHATLEALSENMAIQFVVAAPIVAASGKFTHYVLTRKQVGNNRRVYIRGRRRFCESEHTNSIT
jgi:chromosome condensin MukBEF ATPase and DNA-binding subunit MukB